MIVWFNNSAFYGDYRRTMKFIQTMPRKTTPSADLFKLVPYGHLATKKWLLDQGLDRHTIDNLVKSKQLIAQTPGVYRRPDTIIGWQGVICSLQRMNFGLTVGGLTALELQGYAQYIPLSDRRIIELYAWQKLPSWINKIGLRETFRWHSNRRNWHELEIEGIDTNFTKNLPWGEQSTTLTISSNERAICELLVDVPDRISFEHADQLMQGLTSLSPHRLKNLLHAFKHVKAKRLFFWLAERHNHSWRQKLDPDRFDLGSGKRLIAKDGKLNRKYRITVPTEMSGENDGS